MSSLYFNETGAPFVRDGSGREIELTIADSHTLRIEVSYEDFVAAVFEEVD